MNKEERYKTLMAYIQGEQIAMEAMPGQLQRKLSLPNGQAEYQDYAPQFIMRNLFGETVNPDDVRMKPEPVTLCSDDLPKALTVKEFDALSEGAIFYTLTLDEKSIFSDHVAGFSKRNGQPFCPGCYARFNDAAAVSVAVIKLLRARSEA